MRRVEPSMSVNTNVTVPDGNLVPPATISIAFHAHECDPHTLVLRHAGMPRPAAEVGAE